MGNCLILQTTLFEVFRSITSLLFNLLKFIIKRRGFGRFILLTPSIFQQQILYDRKLKRTVKIFIRDNIDLQTLKMIWLWGDYDLNRLRIGKNLEKLYMKLVTKNQTPLIVDLGGHAGISASYFAYNYSWAHIVVLEPDYLNYVQIQKNTSQYENVSVKNAAISDVCGRGELLDPGLGNDAYRMQFSRPEGAVTVVDIQEILADYSKPSFVPFLVKCDIEGSESQLFKSNTNWITDFSVLVIELHDWLFPGAETSKNFLKTISLLRGDIVQSGENTFFIQHTFLDDTIK